MRVTHIGFYTNPETGLVENIGLKVDKNDMLAYADYIKNDMDSLHITIKTLNGGKPINTSKCEWVEVTPQVFEDVMGSLLTMAKYISLKFLIPTVLTVGIFLFF